MNDNCYVIYAIHKNKETGETEGISIISCVDTTEKVYKYLNGLKGKYNAAYLNEHTLCINDEHFPYLDHITFQAAIKDL